MGPPIRDLNRGRRLRARDTIAIGFFALQSVLAEHFVECISALLEEVLVVGLFYNRERRNDLRRYHIREQFARKGVARHACVTKFVDGAPCGGEQEVPTGGNEAWVEGIAGKGQVDNGS